MSYVEADELVPIFEVVPPEPQCSLYRRAFDVVRRGIVAKADSPPGIYLDPADQSKLLIIEWPSSEPPPLAADSGTAFQQLTPVSTMAHTTAPQSPTTSTTNDQTSVSGSPTSPTAYTGSLTPRSSSVGNAGTLVSDLEYQFEKAGLQAWEDPQAGTPPVVSVRPRGYSRAPATALLGLQRGTYFTGIEPCTNTPIDAIDSQLYGLRIEIPPRQVPSDLVEQVGETSDVSHPVLALDTGSCTTWVTGLAPRELVDFDRQTLDYHVRPLDESRYNHEVLVDKDLPYYLECTKEARGTLSPHQAWMTYADSSAVLLQLQPKPTYCTIHRCFNWSAKAWSSPLSMDFRFGVAWALSRKVLYDKADGIIGLGPEGPEAFWTDPQSMSFLDAVGKRVRPAIDRDTKCKLTIMYFNFERPQARDRVSWMAINRWPCEVVPNWSRRIPTVGLGRTWEVRIIKLQFFMLGPDDESVDLDNGTIMFGTPGAGMKALLDSGSSVNEFPPAAVEEIRAFLARHAHDTPHDTPQSESDSAPLHPPTNAVASASNAPDEDTILVPLLPFACERRPRATMNTSASTDILEGLIYPCNTNRNQVAVLGIPFFQSACVEMVKPEPDEGMQPYVRLAGRWRNKYKLPPTLNGPLSK
ncbi:hypothetical protein C8Q76DRAFT_800945 [Earliella scabrosa]|nr:hypothetical protein C8Q76DRAFT_800945 [Earliella scabrosa]